jgi:hypothetical protein
MKTKEPTLRIGRRDFTAQGIMLLLAGVTVSIADAACGSSSPTSPSAGGTPTPAADVSGSVSDNHGHIATITGAQITAGNAVTLNIQGNATHNHTVDLTAAEVVQAGQKQKVSKSSSNTAGHDHTVTFNG